MFRKVGQEVDDATGGHQRPEVSISMYACYALAPPDNDGYDRTSPVGHYQPNAFGLYGMAGTEDCWNYNSAPVDGSASTTTCDENSRVIRGVSWGNFPGSLRAANRSGDFGPYYYIGFRLAGTLI